MSEEKKKSKVIGNKSDGYNYKYTSLADLVRADVELPPMRVAVLVDGEKTPVLDKDGNPIEYIEAEVLTENGTKREWIRGAKIVVPSGNKMNEAQAYGAALTYARRYTALTVLGIACDDDNKIEVHSKEESEEQQLENMRRDLEALYKQTTGKNFDKWLDDCGGLTIKNYPVMAAKLKKIITDAAEQEAKKENENE